MRLASIPLLSYHSQGMLLDLIDTGVGHVICFGQKVDRCVMKWSLPCVCTLDLRSELHSEKYICQVTMDLGRIRDMWNRYVTNQQPSVGDLCLQKSHLAVAHLDPSNSVVIGHWGCSIALW